MPMFKRVVHCLFFGSVLLQVYVLMGVIVLGFSEAFVVELEVVLVENLD